MRNEVHSKSSSSSLQPPTGQFISTRTLWREYPPPHEGSCDPEPLLWTRKVKRHWVLLRKVVVWRATSQRSEVAELEIENDIVRRVAWLHLPQLLLWNFHRHGVFARNGLGWCENISFRGVMRYPCTRNIQESVTSFRTTHFNPNLIIKGTCSRIT